jgi:hypothetical protein
MSINELRLSFAETLTQIAIDESKIENLRTKLCLHDNFEPYAAYRRIDINK